MTTQTKARVLGIAAAIALFEGVPLVNAAITYADDRAALVQDVHVAVSDRVAPAIGHREVETQPTKAVLRWEDSESTWVWVYYAVPEEEAAAHATLNGTVLTDGVFAAEHEVTIDGLQPGSEYRYIVESTDASGNVAATELASFRAE
jgi:hypothetical protein